MKKSSVREWMTTKIIKADPHTRLHDALRVMNRSNIRTLPVVESNELVGIVTKRDLMRADVTSVMRDIWDQYRQVGNLALDKIMSKAVITVQDDASMAKAAQMLLENKITALPVVNSEQDMVGIITSTDMFRMLVEAYPELNKEILVGDYMTRDTLTIGPATTLLDAQRLMATRRIRTLPVMQDGLLVGIVTRTDLLSAAPAHAAGEDEYEIAKQVLTTPVRFIMTNSPITIGEHEPITEAAKLMAEYKIHSLPVLDASRNLCGIITETDIFRMIVNQLF